MASTMIEMASENDEDVKKRADAGVAGTSAASPDVQSMTVIEVNEFGAPEVMAVRHNARIPDCPSGFVRIRVITAGVNPIDTYVRESASPIGRPPLPWVPGLDAAGYVDAVGAGVYGVSLGERVFTMAAKGAYAEYTLADARFVYPLASRLTFAQGAALGIPYFTAYRALFQRCPVKPGETVLVHGASGAVGIACLQLAQNRGFTLLATAGSVDGMRLVKSASNGVIAIDHSQSGYVDQIRRHAPQGIDVIIEMLANRNLPTDIDLLRSGGRIVVVGCRDAVTFEPRALMRKEAYVCGVAVRRAPPHEAFEMRSGVLSAIEACLVEPIVHKEYGMNDVSQAHHDIVNLPARGKLVVRISDDAK